MELPARDDYTLFRSCFTMVFYALRTSEQAYKLAGWQADQLELEQPPNHVPRWREGREGRPALSLRSKTMDPVLFPYLAY